MNIFKDVNEAKETVIKAGKLLLEKDLVARTWGNVSVRLEGGRMAISPSGRTYEELTVDDIVIVDIETLEYQGGIKPSSEKGIHAAIYKARKDVNAVIHTHQMNASTCAAAGRTVPPILDDMVQILGPDVRVAAYALPGSKKLVKESVKALRGRTAVLLANHGAVCVGKSADDAFVAAQVLEKACKAFIEAEFMGGAKKINKFEAHLMHKYYIMKYSKDKEKNR